MKHAAGAMMTEPATTTAAGALAVKLGLSLGAGAAGAIAMAAFDPPASRITLFAQALVAGLFAIMGTPLTVRLLDYYVDAIDLSNASIWDAMEVVLPTGFMIGALSWGVVGAIAKFREILRSRAAEALAERVGMGVTKE